MTGEDHVPVDLERLPRPGSHEEDGRRGAVLVLQAHEGRDRRGIVGAEAPQGHRGEPVDLLPEVGDPLGQTPGHVAGLGRPHVLGVLGPRLFVDRAGQARLLGCGDLIEGLGGPGPQGGEDPLLVEGRGQDASLPAVHRAPTSSGIPRIRNCRDHAFALAIATASSRIPTSSPALGPQGVHHRRGRAVRVAGPHEDEGLDGVGGPGVETPDVVLAPGQVLLDPGRDALEHGTGEGGRPEDGLDLEGDHLEDGGPGEERLETRCLLAGGPSHGGPGPVEGGLGRCLERPGAEVEVPEDPGHDPDHRAADPLGLPQQGRILGVGPEQIDHPVDEVVGAEDLHVLEGVVPDRGPGARRPRTDGGRAAAGGPPGRDRRSPARGRSRRGCPPGSPPPAPPHPRRPAGRPRGRPWQ